MARVCYIEPVDHLHGSIGKRSKIVYKQRAASGKSYLCYKSEIKHEPTPAQTAQMSKFRQAAAEVKTILADMTQTEAYRKAWEAQRSSGKYSTLRGFIFAQVMSTL